MRQFPPAVLLCSSAGVSFCVPEPSQEGGDGQVPLAPGATDPHPGLWRSVVCLQPSQTFLTQVQLNHSAPLFPPCLVKCGIILFSFPFTWWWVGSQSQAPLQWGSGCTGVFSPSHTWKSKLIYVCDSLGRRKSFKQVGSGGLGFKILATGLKKSLAWETGLVMSLHPTFGLVAVVAKG